MDGKCKDTFVMPVENPIPVTRRATEAISEALTRLIALVFVLVFTATGLGAQWFWWRGASQAFEAQAWVEQPAELIEWSLQAVGSPSMTTDPVWEAARTLRARFRYQVNGRTYESSQVFVAPLVDTVSDGDRDRAIALLQKAENDGGRLRLWRDPARPERAVLIRDLPAAFAAGLLAFMVFPCGPATAVVLGTVLSALARLRGLGVLGRWSGRLWCLWHGSLAAVSLLQLTPASSSASPPAVVILVAILMMWWVPLRALWTVVRKLRPRV